MCVVMGHANSVYLWKQLAELATQRQQYEVYFTMYEEEVC